MSASPFDFYDLGSKIVVGIASGGSAAWFASKLALKKFYREKWWDKNYEAYLSLIDDLIYMRDSYANLYAFEEDKHHGYAREDDRPEIDWDKMALIGKRMEKHLYTAALTLSRTTSESIEEFTHKTKLIDKQVEEGSKHVFIAYDELSFIADDLLKKVVNDARENLGLISLKEKIESMERI
ncbi:hypothetical protein GHV16_19145 [Klebsiella pneumoniae]|nr:hypothetical protein [Klebsiella pneumoniae]